MLPFIRQHTSGSEKIFEFSGPVFQKLNLSSCFSQVCGQKHPPFSRKIRSTRIQFGGNGIGRMRRNTVNLEEFGSACSKRGLNCSIALSA